MAEETKMEKQVEETGQAAEEAKPAQTGQGKRKRSQKRDSDQKTKPEANNSDETKIEKLQEQMENMGSTIENLMNLLQNRLTNDESALDFTRRDIVSATPTEKAQLYKKEDVYEREGEVVKTPSVIRKEEYDMLTHAAASVPKSICRGEIVGYSTPKDGPLMAEVMMDGTKGIFMIFIPFYELFEYSEEDFSKDVYKANELKARLNSHIEFCITEVYESDGFAIGSRLAALEQRGAQLFKARGDRAPAVYPDKYLNATVISVRTDRIYVTIGGADCMLKSRQLSWNSLQNLDDEFEVGQTIAVRVKSIEKYKYESKAPQGAQKRQDYALYKVELSAKEAAPNPAELFYHHFWEGKVVSGTIKSYTDKYVYVNLQGKMDCICYIPKVGRPAPGTPCTVQITLTKDDEKRIFGKIID